MGRILGKLQELSTRALFGKETPTTKELFYELVDRDMGGKEVPMKSFEGQLPQLVDSFGSRGFKVLAFPCNQFGAQEPGTHEEILKFVEKFPGARDKLTFFEKAHVNGAETREVYSFMKQKLGDGEDIRWNFAKFLVDHEGTPYKRYASKVDPLDIAEDIEMLLKKKEAAM